MCARRARALWTPPNICLNLLGICTFVFRFVFVFFSKLKNDIIIFICCIYCSAHAKSVSHSNYCSADIMSLCCLCHFSCLRIERRWMSSRGLKPIDRHTQRGRERVRDFCGLFYTFFCSWFFPSFRPGVDRVVEQTWAEKSIRVEYFDSSPCRKNTRLSKRPAETLSIDR